MPQQRKYKWYPNVRRYRDKRGRYIAGETIAGYMHEMTQDFARKLHAATLKLVNDFSEEKFDRWQRDTRRNIESMHNAAAIIALGGKKAALALATENGSAWQEVERAKGDQMRYFDRFMLGVISGAVPINDALATRAALYPLAGYATYENAVRVREMVAVGNEREEARVLATGAEHCEDCLEQAALGFVRMGTLRRIGETKCGSRCRCRFKYRKKPQENG